MLRKFIVIIIAFVPVNIVRIFFYNILLGYNISYECRIGMFNYINADRCCLNKAAIGKMNYIEPKEFIMEKGSWIGKYNRFKMINSVVMREKSFINAGNVFFGTRSGISPFKKKENLTIGKGSEITTRHIFDLSDTITIGDNVTVAGSGSQFWTHSFDFGHAKMQAPINIGDDAYIGTRSVVTPGVKITSQVSVGAGTTVSKSITEPGFYVSSSLVRKGEAPDYSTEDIVEHNGARFFRRKDHRDSKDGA